MKLIRKEEKTNVQGMMVNAHAQQGNLIYRAGGISAILFGIAYIFIMGLYAPMGAPPSGAEVRLAYHSGNTTMWWSILGLSVLTDFLLVPVALSLYLALERIDRNSMLVATACMGLFIILDLAVTWTNYAALLTLSGDYAVATTSTQRAVLVTAAIYPSVVLESSLTFVYNTLTLAVGILLTSLVMLKGIFGKSTAYLGLTTGILGIIAVVGPSLISSLNVTIIFASVLTTVWALFVGYQLNRLAQLITLDS